MPAPSKGGSRGGGGVVPPFDFAFVSDYHRKNSCRFFETLVRLHHEATKATMKQPDIEQIRKEIKYDPDTGELRWLSRKQGRRLSGLAGSVTNGSQGYVLVRAGGMSVLGHRLAWALHYGSWPEGILDHINGNRSDNRISNLRLADADINSQNRRSSGSHSTTGLLGVTRFKIGNRRERFRAVISVNGKQRYLGFFDTPQAAHAAYLDAKRKLHSGCTI